MTRRIVLAALAGAMLAACGSTALPPSVQTFLETNIGSRWCPFVITATGRYVHTDASLQLSTLVGKRTAAAEAEIRRHGCEIRVLIDDGRENVRTNDLRPNRVNLDLSDGRVIAAVAF
jgi:hypothetical protein